jgi:hypothetical protein
MTGVAWLCGDETLGTEAINDPKYPLGAKLPIPRMIIAQYDSIQNQIVLGRKMPRVLQLLSNTVRDNDISQWFTVYLVVFMILHETAISTRDRYRWARDRTADVRELSSMTSCVSQLADLS